MTPHSGRQQNFLGGDNALICFNADNFTLFHNKALHFNIFKPLGTIGRRTFLKCHRNIKWIDLTVRRNKQTGFNIFCDYPWPFFGNIIAREKLCFNFHPGSMVMGPQQLLMAHITKGNVYRAIGLISCGLSGFEFQITKQLGCIFTQLCLGCTVTQLSHNTCGMPCGATCNFSTFK